MSKLLATCPECEREEAGLDRRDFLRVSAAAGASVASAGVFSRTVARADQTGQMAKSETLAAQLYGSLSDEQKELICFKFDDPLRQKVDNNWRITSARVAQHFNGEQRSLIKEIFLKLHSEEYAQQVFDQVVHDHRRRDDRGDEGFGRCSVAFFGEPETGKFEFVLTGRHVTRRCDGDSVEGAAFGGPIFYGHAASGFDEPSDHRGNVYWFQGKRANELFQALDGSQRAKALRTDPRPERRTETVKLSGTEAELHGIPVSELSSDQKQLAVTVMEDVLAPFRKVDRDECMKLIKKNDIDKLHFAYYKNMDIGDDGVWDVWQIEGPSMVWYFRGKPHVHTWVHIREAVEKG